MTKRKTIHQLYEEAGSLHNLSRNTRVPVSTLQYLVNNEARPNYATKELLEPFLSGKKDIKQIVRPYRKRE